MPRNTTVQKKGSSAALVRMSSPYYNAKMFHFKFMNRLPISGHNLKVTYKTRLSKNSSHNFCTPVFDEKLPKSEKIMQVDTVFTK
jgi:hypothetical protein